MQTNNGEALVHVSILACLIDGWGCNECGVMCKSCENQVGLPVTHVYDIVVKSN